MSSTTPRLGLPYLASGQAQKHVTLNEALALVDGLLHPAVESRTLTIEPSAPLDGQAWILPEGAAGAAWSSRPAGALVRFDAAAGWVEAPELDGLTAFLRDEGILVARHAGAWRDAGALVGAIEETPRLGVGAGAMTNAETPLVARLNRALFTAPDGEAGSPDVRLSLNGAEPGAVASVVFQTAHAGHGEVGLDADGRLALRVSDDGETWSDALSAALDTGLRARLPLDFTDLAARTDRAAARLAPGDRIYGEASDAETPGTTWLECSEYGFWHLVYDNVSALQVSDYWVHSERRFNTSEHFQVAGQQVVGARGAPVADATDAASAVTQLNFLLARLRAHGLIAVQAV